MPLLEQIPSRLIKPAVFARPGDGAFSQLNALLVDERDVSRVAVAHALRQMGLARVKPVSSPDEARGQLRVQAYDLILTEYHFSMGETGLDLIEDIRARRLVPFTTLLVMLTGEAMHERVAAVVETALDAYLLKPVNPAMLEARLSRALAKKTALLPIWTSVEQEDFHDALSRCEAMIAQREPFWLDAARISAEINLALKRHREADGMYELVQEEQALPWARLPVSSPAADAGARGLDSEATGPEAGDTYQRLARCFIEDGDPAAALNALRRGVSAIPADLTRLQSLGSLAFLLGQVDEARQVLDRAVRLASGNRPIDPSTLLALVLLAAERAADEPMAAVDARAHADRLALDQAAHPDDSRLAILTEMATVRLLVLDDDKAKASAGLLALDARLEHPAFDLSCALHLLLLMRGLAAQGLAPADPDGWVRRVARRHAGTRIASSLLALALRQSPALAALVEDEHTRLTREIAEAMSMLLRADIPGAATRLEALLRDSRSPRIAQLAEGLLDRHGRHLSAIQTSELQDAIDSICPPNLRTRGHSPLLA
ncbi:MAG: response regulator [Betaproteobacteria bacterium]|nr:response regulator [Betaproteobacteria bacterium]